MGGKLNIWYLLHIVDSGTPACFIGKLNIFIKIECSEKVLICSINSVTYILRISVNTTVSARDLWTCLKRFSWGAVWWRPSCQQSWVTGRNSESCKKVRRINMMIYELGSNAMLKRMYFFRQDYLMCNNFRKGKVSYGPELLLQVSNALAPKRFLQSFVFITFVFWNDLIQSRPVPLFFEISGNEWLCSDQPDRQVRRLDVDCQSATF